MANSSETNQAGKSVTSVRTGCLILLASSLLTACTSPNDAATVGTKARQSAKNSPSMQPQQTTSKMTDTPLESVPGWSDDQIARTKKAWITTAEQVVALSATPNGTRSLAEQLNVSENEARRLVDAARATLSPTVRQEMEQSIDPSQYGLGVRRPE